MGHVKTWKKWDKCSQEQLENLVASGCTIPEISAALHRTERSVQCRLRLSKLYIKETVQRCGPNRVLRRTRRWSRVEDFKLLTCADQRLTHEETARVLGRSRRSVITRAARLKIRWQPTMTSISEIARQYGLYRAYVRSLVRVFLSQKFKRITKSSGCTRRYFLDDEDLDRLHRIIYMKRKLHKLKECKIVDAKWTRNVNMLVLKCPDCGNKVEHRSDRYIVNCPCGMQGYVEGKPPPGARVSERS